MSMICMSIWWCKRLVKEVDGCLLVDESGGRVVEEEVAAAWLLRIWVAGWLRMRWLPAG